MLIDRLINRGGTGNMNKCELSNRLRVGIIFDWENQWMPLHQPSHSPEHPAANTCHCDHYIRQAELWILSSLVACIRDEACKDTDDKEDSSANPEWG